MYLSAPNARVAVLGSLVRWEALNFCAPAPSCSSASLLPFPSVTYSSVVLDIVNISNPNAPSPVIDKLRIDGSLVGSRLIGNSLVLVTQHSPKLPVDLLPWNAPAAEREAALNRLTTADLLPTITVNGGAPSPLVQETDCFIEPKNASYGLEVTSITVVDLSSPTLQRSSRCFMGGTEAVYMSTSSLYLATTSSFVTPLVNSSRLVYPAQISTDVHKFALVKTPSNAVTTVDFRGSGSVKGHLGWSTQQRSYRMSEHDGHLRVLTFTGSSGWGVVTDAGNPSAPAPSPATLTILREATTGKTLQTVGQLPNKDRPQAIGKPGEQVYAVRFIGDRGYVVTFRQVDPLYILDLSQPSDPKTTGELTIAGFSDYLFPVGPTGSGLLLGVGKDADLQGMVGGVKVALFDVRNPSKPEQKASFTVGRIGSWSALDYNRHGIDLFTRGNQTRVVLPVMSAQINFLGAYTASSALQRFEIDSSTRSMKLISPLAQTANYRSVHQDRTLQVGDMVHYLAPDLNSTSLASYAW
ncbi:MAG: beta-propeller domain-containing protein [Burkholderiales bacterium]